MDEQELRLRCAEAAIKLADMQRPLVHHDVEGVVKIAQQVYDFCNAPPQAEKPKGTEDKPGRGKLTLPKT